ncbi:hypothetical protein QJS04_geneDACA000406 [Acorus gramineus]|uniref:KIB1-4 beta-propeller domain-containing protein n=1 Tax=Acorus gramineus TaxID=55184 RepID=A0AAV9AT40_ACOGR|nr:hypothetical protein QJS04_geneDACA000406 [Acorus gramineus]
MAAPPPPPGPPPPPQPPRNRGIPLSQLPWILTPHHPTPGTVRFIKLGGFSECDVPWNFVRGCFLVARIHAWVLLEEYNTGNLLLLNPPTQELLLLPRPLLAPRRVTCTALLSMPPDGEDFWLFLSEGNRIFAIMPRIGYWFLRSLYCDIISMASTATTGDRRLLCLMKDLRLVMFDISADRVTILEESPPANSVVPPCTALEHFVILHQGKRILVAVVLLSFMGLWLYIVRDRSWEPVGPDIVRNHVLVLVGGGHSFSFRAPRGQKGRRAYLVPSPAVYNGVESEWGPNPMWTTIDF